MGSSTSKNSSPLMRPIMSEPRIRAATRCATFTKKRVTNRMRIIVVDVLEIVDVDERMCKSPLLRGLATSSDYTVRPTGSASRIVTVRLPRRALLSRQRIVEAANGVGVGNCAHML